jgi:DNA-binding NtrC family response regulator
MTPHTPSLPRNDDIPPASVSETKLISAVHDPKPPSAPLLDDDWPTLSVLSRRYINRALAHTGGNKTRAADLLGIDRRTLNRILARERARRRNGGVGDATH